MLPQRLARLTVNGVRQREAPVVVGVLEASSGRLVFAGAAEADEASGGAVLRAALEAASPGDELLLAVAEDLDYSLIERLRLLLVAAGGAPRETTLEERGTTLAFRGRIGAEEGSSREALGDDEAELVDPDQATDCRLAPIGPFEMKTGARRR
jgi:hypothetical protein